MKQVIIESKMIKYSKFSEPLLDNTIYLNFNKNGILNIITDEINQTYYWKWSDKEKNLISILGDGDFNGLYEIGDNISSDFLFLSKEKEDIDDNMVMLSFIPKKRN